MPRMIRKLVVTEVHFYGPQPQIRSRPIWRLQLQALEGSVEDQATLWGDGEAAPFKAGQTVRVTFEEECRDSPAADPVFSCAAAEAKAGRPTIVYTMGVPRFDVMSQLLADEVGKPLAWLAAGIATLSPEERERIPKELAERPLIVRDDPCPTIEMVRDDVRRLLVRTGAEPIVFVNCQAPSLSYRAVLRVLHAVANEVKFDAMDSRCRLLTLPTALG